MKETTTSKQSQDEDVRNQILDNAIKVFAERGFGGTYLREIAQRSGVSHSMIKYYFGSKEKLWRAAVSFLFDRQFREAAPALTAVNDGDRQGLLRALIQQMIRYSARHPEHSRLIMQASMTPGPHLDWIVAHLRELHDLYYPEGSALSEDSDDRPDIVAIITHYLIYGACHTIFALEHEARGLYGIDVADPVFIDRFVQVATEMLMPAEMRGAEAIANRDAGEALGCTSNKPDIQMWETETTTELRISIPKA